MVTTAIFGILAFVSFIILVSSFVSPTTLIKFIYGRTANKKILIVFEGIDGVGKTTHMKMLFDRLDHLGYNVGMVRFPNRFTNIGQLLLKYLHHEIDFDPYTAHLLFAANRWETRSELTSHQIIIVDRYFYSGAAYSLARGVPKYLCLMPDSQLPKPDIVFYLYSDARKVGSERGETIEFQNKVAESFKIFMNRSWNLINLDKFSSIDQVHSVIFDKVGQYLHKK